MSPPSGDRCYVRIVFDIFKTCPDVRRLALFEILSSEYLGTTGVQVVIAIFWSSCVGTTPNRIVIRVSYALSSSFDPATLSSLLGVFLDRRAKVCQHLARLIAGGTWPGVTWGIAGRSSTKLQEKVNATAGRACFCFMFRVRVGVSVSPNPAAGSSLCAVALSHSHTRDRSTFSWDIVLTPPSPPCQNHSGRR